MLSQYLGKIILYVCRPIYSNICTRVQYKKKRDLIFAREARTILNYAILWELQSRIYLRRRAYTLFRTPAEGNHTFGPNDLIQQKAWNAEVVV